MVCYSMDFAESRLYSPIPCAKIMLIRHTDKHLAEKYGFVCTFFEIVCENTYRGCKSAGIGGGFSNLSELSDLSDLSDLSEIVRLVRQV